MGASTTGRKRGGVAKLVKFRDKIPDAEFEEMLLRAGHRKVTPAEKEPSTREEEFGGPTALILAPTRELAMQIHSHLTQVAKHTQIKVRQH